MAIHVRSLLRHMELYYSDASIVKDISCVLDCIHPDDTKSREVIEQYGKLRRKAPGFRKFDFKANNHNRIHPAALDKLIPGTAPGEARMVACGRCGNEFSAARSDAKFCSAKCRQKSSRMAR